MMGQIQTKEKSKTLSQEDKAKLSKYHQQIFFGLTAVIWARNTKLGTAWQRANETLDTFIKINTRNTQDSAATYLRQTHAAHMAKWSQIIVTNPNSEKLLELPKDKQIQWANRASKNINDAMKELTVKLKEFKESQNKTPEDFKLAQYKAQQQANKKPSNANTPNALPAAMNQTKSEQRTNAEIRLAIFHQWLKQQNNDNRAA